MRNPLLLTAITALALIQATPAAAANEAGKEFYLRLDGGLVLKNRISKGYGDTGHAEAVTMKTKKNTGVFDIGVGVYASDHLRADLTYNQHSSVKRTVNYVDIETYTTKE